MNKNNFSLFRLVNSIFIIGTFVFVVACEDVAETGTREFDSTDSKSNSSTKNSNCDSNNVDCAIENPDNIGSINNPIEVVKVELRHLVEPKLDEQETGGDYLRKLTIPKNYSGFLYVAGVNVSSLAPKNVKVRFRFGLSGDHIDVPATVSTAPGITPATNVQVLVLDMRSMPFKDVRLLYELYDYNDYSFDGSTNATAIDDPVDSNRNSKLYCRGLALNDDHTFNGNLAAGCNDLTDECKYAYAKVVDKGLVVDSNDLPLTPVEAEIDVDANGYYLDGDDNMLGRCLPNVPIIGTSHVYNNSLAAFVNGGAAQDIDGTDYRYEGPYNGINYASWQITGNAIFGTYGLYRDYMGAISFPGVTSQGFDSLLYPRYAKRNLQTGVEYWGITDLTDPSGTGTVQTMTANGESEWMNGCNERATTVDESNGEHVGSCNISARIEIISVDDNEIENIIDSNSEVKLQLVKAQNLNTELENVLLTSFNSCSSSSACGADECCFNKRCWSKDLVSQCMEDAPSYGNGIPGDSCQSDFQCASLCCNSSGSCSVHDPSADTPVLCSKPVGTQCIAKEWCEKSTVTKCYIVKGRINPAGSTECSLQCFAYQEHGDCSNGRCTPPDTPVQPVFNPDDPNRCDTAIDPTAIPLPSNS